MKVDIDTVKFVSEATYTVRGSKRGITVPKAVVDTLELKNGDRLMWIMFEDRTLILTKEGAGL